MSTIAEVAWDANGCIPVIVQDASTKEVLALGTTDRAGLIETLATGRATYRLSPEGAAPNCVLRAAPQMITAVRLSCDGRALLFQVQPADVICRTGQASCFHGILAADQPHERDQSPPRRRARSSVAIRWHREAAEGS